jgi:hypothetical protein
MAQYSALTTANATFSQNPDGSIDVQLGPFGFTMTKQELRLAMRDLDCRQSFIFQSIQALSAAGIDPSTATLAQLKTALQAVNYVMSV